MKENVEEDIARIAKLITTKFNNDYSIDNKDKEAIEHILSDYKRVLKENEQLNKKVDLMENYMVENGWEICFDNIYAELNNCNGMERDWCRGDKIEELQNGPLKINENNKYYYETEAYNKIIIQVLQELLEGRK